MFDSLDSKAKKTGEWVAISTLCHWSLFCRMCVMDGCNKRNECHLDYWWVSWGMRVLAS